jgi:CheY-like chemotaxis protein
MLNIINDIINISKVESNQMKANLSETSIHEQIEYISTFFRPEAEQKGIHLKISSGNSSKDPVIITDREKLYAILTNLVKNALKFTREGSIEIGYELRKEYVEFHVRDTGIGVRPGQQEMIFERFRQGSESLSRNYEGAGLGLAISKAYVEMLGGKIWVESELGKGSTFYFFLPIQSKNPSCDLNYLPTNIDEESGVKNLKILIAEDDPFSAMLLRKALEQYGKNIYVARTGSEAVDYCKNNSDFDLVMMDIQMPEMNGYEAASKIREFDSKVVIIAQTAFALSGDKEKVIAAGCNDYISKPLKKENLEVLIKKHFEK